MKKVYVLTDLETLGVVSDPHDMESVKTILEKIYDIPFDIRLDGGEYIMRFEDNSEKCVWWEEVYYI